MSRRRVQGVYSAGRPINSCFPRSGCNLSGIGNRTPLRMAELLYPDCRDHCWPSLHRIMVRNVVCAVHRHRRWNMRRFVNCHTVTRAPALRSCTRCFDRAWQRPRALAWCKSINFPRPVDRRRNGKRRRAALARLAGGCSIVPPKPLSLPRILAGRMNEGAESRWPI